MKRNLVEIEKPHQSLITQIMQFYHKHNPLSYKECFACDLVWILVQVNYHHSNIGFVTPRSSDY